MQKLWIKGAPFRSFAGNISVMHTNGTQDIIPHFSLAESSQQGHRLFEVREAGGERGQVPEEMFRPHRKDYYFFFLVKAGDSRHWVDFVSYRVQPGRLYFTLPHQVHVKEKAAPIAGTVLAFTEEFLAIGEQLSLKELPILQNPYEAHELDLLPGERTQLDHLLAQMLAEFGQDQDWKETVLHSLLEIFLVYLSRVYSRQFAHNGHQAVNRTLTKHLINLVNKNFDRLHQVSEYAPLLHISPGHLNDVIREQTGRTATELIHERILLEAKRTLFHSSLSAKEIAYRLGFEDAAYFNRFFKRLAGETPAAFRRAAREKYH